MFFQDLESQYGEFPWMAAVMWDRGQELKYVAGGALIAPNVVLTAAHRIRKYNKPSVTLSVRLGDWDSRITQELFHHQDIKVKEVIIHEHFNRGNLNNDVALLILENDFTAAPHIGTVCLPELEDFSTSTCTVTGWGAEEYAKSGNFQNILKKIDLPVVENGECELRLKTTILSNSYTLHDSFMCAGGEEGKDACTGDGGSPLVCQSLKDPSKYHVVGLVAFGLGCGEIGIPGVYANINRQETLQWINEKLRNV